MARLTGIVASDEDLDEVLSFETRLTLAALLYQRDPNGDYVVLVGAGDLDEANEATARAALEQVDEVIIGSWIDPSERRGVMHLLALALGKPAFTFEHDETDGPALYGPLAPWKVGAQVDGRGRAQGAGTLPRSRHGGRAHRQRRRRR